MAALKPVGVNTTLSTSGTASTSIPIAQQSDAIRVACEGAGVHVKVDGDPVATVLDYYVTTGEPETISIGPVQSQRVVGITTGATTIIDFPEGTGCPFSVGEYVSLTVDGQSDLDFEHQQIASINNTSNVGGYYNTRCTVSYDSASVTTVFNGVSATLRKSIKVSVVTNSGTGTAFIQQVQDS